MSDVLQNASKYRSRLKAELDRVDEFLRMAEEFSKVGPDGSLQLGKSNGEAQAAPKAEAKAESKSDGKAETEAKAPPAGEAKTPFDRFRANGG